MSRTLSVVGWPESKSTDPREPDLTYLVLAIYLALVVANPCFADFDSSLLALQTKLTGTILPVLSVMGIVFAAFSLLTGNQNAKQHIIYVAAGCLVGFGAQAISNLFKQIIR